MHLLLGKLMLFIPLVLRLELQRQVQMVLFLRAASADLSSVGTLTVGQKFKIDANASDMEMAMINSLVGGMTFTKASDTLTQDIEAVQAKINTARVQAGSQYAAMESAVDYTTDLTAQYELGFNTVK
jgi:hypothetical protein